MTVSLKHTFVSAIPDSADASLVQPSSWNAEHTLTLGANVLLGAVTAGAAQEIGLGAGLSFSGGNLVVSGFAAASHAHIISDVTGLQSALDGKQASGSYSLTGHSHVVADITGLQGQLDGKAATGHTHIIADVTGLQAALDGKQAAGSYAAASHTHAQSDITGLVSALAGKESAITAGTIAQYWRGDKSFQTLDKTAVGLANVDNTSDANKPVSTAQATAIGLKLDATHAGTGGAAHSNVVAAGASGFMTGADKTKLDGIATGATANSSDATLLDRTNHTGTQAATTISDFAATARAQTEAELVAGANVTITPSGSGATRQLTIASTGGGGGSSLGGLATVTITNDAYDWTETVAAIGVTPASRVMVGLAPANDTDENDPLWLSATQMAASAGTDEITISMAFATKEHGPINLHWSAL